MRDRLRALGMKARQDPRSLSHKDLDEICTLAAELTPTHYLVPAKESNDGLKTPFEPIATDMPDLETQTLLRQTHAMECIAFQLSELVKLKKEEVVRERWEAAPVLKSRSS